jgi:hypothetical protein
MCSARGQRNDVVDVDVARRDDPSTDAAYQPVPYKDCLVVDGLALSAEQPRPAPTCMLSTLLRVRGLIAEFALADCLRICEPPLTLLLCSARATQFAHVPIPLLSECRPRL